MSAENHFGSSFSRQSSDMLYLDRPQKIADQESFSETASGEFDWRWLAEALLRRRKLILALPAILAAIAAAYVLLRTPSYTASTQLQLINLRLTFSRDNAFFAESQPDPTFLETQIQIMKSERVILSVLNSLKLLSADAKPEERAEAVTKLTGGFSVKRIASSDVVQISYKAPDPEQAARYANEFARAYVADQNAARTEAAQAGSSWLRERLREVGPKARIIATALPPYRKSNIPGILIVAGAGVMGGLMAVALALIWALLDRRIHTPEQASSAARAVCLGIVPDLRKKTAPVLAGDDDDIRANGFAISDPRQCFGIDHPHSEIWHALRQVKAECDDGFGRKGLRCLGVTSTFAGEGRTTIATNLALTIAASGKRVLLVDCDVYNPELSKRYAGSAPAGLIEYLRDQSASLLAYVRIEHRTGLHFLPLGCDPGHNLGPDLWSEDARRLFQECSAAYDYVIFDMPTLAMAGDVRAAARYLDGFLLVVRSAHVTAEDINVGLGAAVGVRERLIGALLNRVDKKDMRWMLSPEIGFSRRRQKWSTKAA
jgi:Mrp family chromosome partitioning ATPase/capsular polysaccharide biosynthesis protein